MRQCCGHPREEIEAVARHAQAIFDARFPLLPESSSQLLWDLGVEPQDWVPEGYEVAGVGRWRLGVLLCHDHLLKLDFGFWQATRTEIWVWENVTDPAVRERLCPILDHGQDGDTLWLLMPRCAYHVETTSEELRDAERLRGIGDYMSNLGRLSGRLVTWDYGHAHRDLSEIFVEPAPEVGDKYAPESLLCS